MKSWHEAQQEISWNFLYSRLIKSRFLLLGWTSVRHMNQANRSIFRKEAIEEYIHEQENKVLLKFVSPRLFLCLWVILGLLSGLGVWLCFAEVPILVSGRGMIIDQDKRISCQGQKPCIVAPPPASLPLQRKAFGKQVIVFVALTKIIVRIYNSVYFHRSHRQ